MHLSSCAMHARILKEDLTGTAQLYMFECGAPEGLWASVLSISELSRALHDQKLDVEIMRCIARMRSPNVSNLADGVGKDRKLVRFHLYKLKAEGS